MISALIFLIVTQSSYSQGQSDFLETGRYRLTDCLTKKCLGEFVVRPTTDPFSKARYIVIPFIEDIWFRLSSLKGVTITEVDSESKLYPDLNERIITWRRFSTFWSTHTNGQIYAKMKFEFDQRSCTLNLAPNPINLKDDDSTNDKNPCAEGSSNEDWSGDHFWKGHLELLSGQKFSLRYEAWDEISNEKINSAGIYLIKK